MLVLFVSFNYIIFTLKVFNGMSRVTLEQKISNRRGVFQTQRWFLHIGIFISGTSRRFLHSSFNIQVSFLCLSSVKGTNLA